MLAAIPTAASGLKDWRYTVGGERRVGLAHAGLNTLALVAYAGELVAAPPGASWRRNRPLRFGGTALTAAGWLGGHLSYALGVGVDTTAFQHSPAEWTAVAAEADVVSDRLLAASADGVPVLLTRAPDGTLRCWPIGAPIAVPRCMRASCAADASSAPGTGVSSRSTVRSFADRRPGRRRRTRPRWSTVGSSSDGPMSRVRCAPIRSVEQG